MRTSELAGRARIADLQRMRDSLSDLIATCGLPRADRTCTVLRAIENQPGLQTMNRADNPLIVAGLENERSLD